MAQPGVPMPVSTGRVAGCPRLVPRDLWQFHGGFTQQFIAFGVPVYSHGARSRAGDEGQ